MAHTVIKKVRLDADYNTRLGRLADHLKATESDVLRRGIDLVEEMTRRDKALERLKELAAIKGPQKERYRFR